MLAMAPEHRYVPSSAKGGIRSWATLPSRPWWRMSRYGVAEQLRMPRVLAGLKADIVHIPHWNVPLAFRGRFVVTVHDLLLRTFPESAKASADPAGAMGQAGGLSRRFGSAIRRAFTVLVPTRAVAEDVQRLFLRPRLGRCGRGDAGAGCRALVPGCSAISAVCRFGVSAQASRSLVAGMVVRPDGDSGARVARRRRAGCLHGTFRPCGRGCGSWAGWMMPRSRRPIVGRSLRLSDGRRRFGLPPPRLLPVGASHGRRSPVLRRSFGRRPGR